jgi:hypothetical protein
MRAAHKESKSFLGISDRTMQSFWRTPEKTISLQLPQFQHKNS